MVALRYVRDRDIVVGPERGEESWRLNLLAQSPEGDMYAFALTARPVYGTDGMVVSSAAYTKVWHGCHLGRVWFAKREQSNVLEIKWVGS